MKRLLACLLVLVLLTGCHSSPAVSKPPDHEPVNLIYYTIGPADRDLQLVEAALNKLLLERYGFTVSYRKIGWNDYIPQINGIINTDQPFDVLFTCSDHYLSKATSGVFMNLTPYLNAQGRTLKQTVDPLFWKGVTVDGQIYGVPTNKELATPIQLLFSQELVDRYHINVYNYQSLDSLEPLLKLISQSEPDCIPLFFNSGRMDLMTMEGYEYVINNESPLMIRSDDAGAQIVNLYETPEAQHLLQTLRRYYLAGYINADAALRTDVSRFDDEQVFCRLSNGGPDSSRSFSLDYGYPILAVQASEAIVNNLSTQGGIMAVNAKTRHPAEATAFLTAVNTDPDVRNLLNFGIEGTHYRIDDNGQAEVLSGGYRGVPYTQGNWFILNTMAGEQPDKWRTYQRFNENAHSSRLLGFSPDLSGCYDLYQAVCRTAGQYHSALMTGSVDPDVYLPKLNKALQDAGISQLIQVLQPQVDAWTAQNNRP